MSPLEPPSGGWRTAAKIAWRESRSSAGKFLFVILAVAAGVGALSGVRGFSGAFRSMLLKDARQLMAGDLSVRMYHEPDAAERKVLDAIVADGAERTWITEAVSMATAPGSPRPLMVSVKAVEPEKYPFYGQVLLRPEIPLREALTPDSIVVTDDLLMRLGVEVGDRIRLGEATYRIAAVVTVEPDRMTGSFNVGPRLLMSRQALDRSELMQVGSRAAQRYLFKIPFGDDSDARISKARAALETVFRKYWIADYRETHPTIRRGLDRATNFLSLVSLVAMIVGALGVAMAMHSHLQQRLDTIAIMKCIGARSNQILRIYLLQTLSLGLVGSLLGVAAGYLVQAGAPRLIANYFPSAPSFSWEPLMAAQALLIGVLTTLLFSAPPLLAIRKIRPALIFRREMEGRSKGLLDRLRMTPAGIVSGGVILTGLAVVAAWLGDSLILGLWFAGGLLVSVLVLAFASWALLRGLEALPAKLPFRLPTALRHGIANLHRPGVHAEAILVALGIGVTFTLSVYLIQSSVLDQMVQSAPPEMPNIFLVNVTSLEHDDLKTFLEGYPGVEEVILTPSVPGRLLSIDGMKLEDMKLGEDGERFRQTRGLTWFDEKPPEEIQPLEGSWWAAGDPSALAGLREDVAETLGVRVGSTLEWMVGRDVITAKVNLIYRVESIRPVSSTYFVLTRSALANRPAVYYGGVRIAPDKALDLQKDAYDRFPTVLVVNVADVIRIVQEVVDQIGLVVQIVSGFAILGGVVILVSSVMATRFRRIRETAILKALGATRAKIAQIFSVEFLLLGLAAGAIGALLASVFSALLLERMLDAHFVFRPWPSLAAAAGTALLANVAGWLASFRILSRKPLEVLRGE
ncbi:MAG: FtsX-like permease family protein [Acidobacteria bacterium]|nr:FtsX-like permease family protein [Acidobacteriota bacterium]